MAGVLVGKEWASEEAFRDVSGLTVALRRAAGIDVIQVVATPPLGTHTFKALFDNRRLDDAGFGSNMDFEMRVLFLKAALRGDKLLSATLRAENGGMQLKARTRMAGFRVDYVLPLERVELDESGVLSAKLKTAKLELAESKAHVAKMQLTIDISKMKISSVMHELDANELQFMDFRAEIQKRDERIVEIEQILADTKGIYLDKTRIQKSKMKASKELLCESEVRVAEMQQIINASKNQNEELRVSRFELTASKERTAKLLAQISSNLAQFADFRAEIRMRDFRIAEIEKIIAGKCAFHFDTHTRTKVLRPSKFVFSSDGNTAEAKTDAVVGVCLEPSVRTDCELAVAVHTLAGGSQFAVALTNRIEGGGDSIALVSDGTVRVNGADLPGAKRAFGPLQMGDELRIKVQLSSDTVAVRSKHGEVIVKWKAPSLPLWFSLISGKKRNQTLYCLTSVY